MRYHPWKIFGDEEEDSLEGRMEHTLKGSVCERLAGLQYQHALGTQALGLELETVPRASINLPLGENAEVQVSEEERLWSCSMSN